MTVEHSLRARFAVATLGLMFAACAQWPLDALPRPSAVGSISGRIRPAANEDESSRETLVHLSAVDHSRARTARSLESGMVEISIKDGRQRPEIVLVRPDEPLRFVNRDSVHHKLFTADRDNLFEVPLRAGERSEPIRLRSEGFLRGFCRMHPDETFSLLVRAVDFVTRVDPEARFLFEDVPEGRYRIRAASVHGETAALPVQVSRGRRSDLEIPLDPGS